MLAEGNYPPANPTGPETGFLKAADYAWDSRALGALNHPLEASMSMPGKVATGSITRLSNHVMRSLLAPGEGRSIPSSGGLPGSGVDGADRVLDNAGHPLGVISYTGPLLRARDWEGTVVPELQVAARRLADRLAGTW